MKVIHRMNRKQYNRGRKSEEVKGEACPEHRQGEEKEERAGMKAFYAE